MIHSQLSQWNIRNKRVFIRADLNITPLSQARGHLKFTRLLTTLSYCKDNHAPITLTTHVGRPQGFEEHLSTQLLIPALQDAGFSVHFCTPETIDYSYNADITLLENLRFYPGEFCCSPEFARQITRQCDFYINDAFGAIAEESTSLTYAPQLFKKHHKSIGFLIEDELTHLSQFQIHDQGPTLLFLGGAKGTDKLMFLTEMLNTVDKIFLCPAVSELQTSEFNTFLHTAKKHHIPVELPHDYLEIKGEKMSFGSETLEAWQPHIMHAQKIIYNGLMGFLEQPETTVYTCELFKLFTQSPARVVLAGGDTVAAAQTFGIASDNVYLSTGGGATLAYLSKKPLAGLNALQDYNSTIQQN